MKTRNWPRFRMRMGQHGADSRVMLDGEDISASVYRVTTEMAVGEPTRVTLYQYPEKALVAGEPHEVHVRVIRARHLINALRTWAVTLAGSSVGWVVSPERQAAFWKHLEDAETAETDQEPPEHNAVRTSMVMTDSAFQEGPEQLREARISLSSVGDPTDLIEWLNQQGLRGHIIEVTLRPITEEER